jgi:hypothetical protein
MSLYAFRNKDTAEKLNRFAGSLDPASAVLIRSNGFRTPSTVVKTGKDGIPGRVENVAGIAKCELVGSALDGTMTGIGSQADVLNPSEDPIPGDTYIVANVCQEVLVAVTEFAPSGNQIIFKIEELYSVAVADSEHCDDKLADAKGKYLAKILHRPCGVTKVEEEEDEKVVVHDLLESFLYGREEAEVIGKIGVATYFSDTDDYDECKWVITWIDWFREVQVVTNVIVTSNQIKFELKNVQVWDDCDLDPITIDLTECPTEY